MSELNYQNVVQNTKMAKHSHLAKMSDWCDIYYYYQLQIYIVSACSPQYRFIMTVSHRFSSASHSGMFRTRLCSLEPSPGQHKPKSFPHCP